MKVLTFLYVVVLRALPVWLLLHLCAKHVLVFYSERYLWLKNWIFSTGLLNLSRSRLDQVSVDALFMILRRGLRLDQGRCAMTLGIDPSTATDTPEQGGHAVVASAPRAHSTAPRCPPPSRAMTLRIDLFTIDIPMVGRSSRSAPRHGRSYRWLEAGLQLALGGGVRRMVMCEERVEKRRAGWASMVVRDRHKVKI